MSQKIRRALAVAAVLSALSLALPVPAHAVVLRHWQPANIASWFWSWLQDLGLVPGSAVPRSAPYQKEGSMIDPNGQPHSGSTPSTPPGTTTSDEGSMLDPNG